MNKRLVWIMLVLVGVLAGAPAAWADDDDSDFQVRVLSSPADMVTGGDALVEVEVPHRARLHNVRVTLNGDDVTAALEPDSSGRTLTGLVDGLELGENTLAVYSRRGHKWKKQDRLELVNHPITGPIFSGPQQQPFVCKTQTQG
jgi:hypothetical protein